MSLVAVCYRRFARKPNPDVIASEACRRSLFGLFRERPLTDEASIFAAAVVFPRNVVTVGFIESFLTGGGDVEEYFALADGA